ncbi:hypothetical protein [Mucilaginibacter sp. UR6-11]|uniref:hypothetical protein n=1 Tax=Mucilaginibacter sp. UR6-11 TaxID=1435644 RepID=UPI001E28CB14|nr:hypothetical protein [Mucilaginibacter sp. UR6-11]MCC8425610.1 hypothetical protein [Mucilaginibacter sp. UR6-11]
MKTLKLAIAAVILACTFQAAKAQVSFGISIGTPPPRRVIVEPYPYCREEVVERYPVRREVFVERAPVRTVYYQRGYYRRPVYVRNTYYRHERFERWHH